MSGLAAAATRGPRDSDSRGCVRVVVSERTRWRPMDIAWMPRGPLVVVAGMDGKDGVVRVGGNRSGFDREWWIQEHLAVGDTRIRTVDAAEAGGQCLVACGDGEGRVRVMDAKRMSRPIFTSPVESNAENQKRGIHSVNMWEKDPRILISSGAEGMVRIWDIRQPSQIASYNVSSGEAWSARFVESEKGVEDAIPSFVLGSSTGIISQIALQQPWKCAIQCETPIPIAGNGICAVSGISKGSTNPSVFVAGCANGDFLLLKSNLPDPKKDSKNVMRGISRVHVGDGRAAWSVRSLRIPGLNSSFWMCASGNGLVSVFREGESTWQFEGASRVHREATVTGLSVLCNNSSNHAIIPSSSSDSNSNSNSVSISEKSPSVLWASTSIEGWIFLGTFIPS